MNDFLDARRHVGILILRIFIGFRLLYGVVDNVINGERMIEFADFLEANGFPFPLVSATISVYLQFFGAIFILLGFKIRIASIFLSVNFLVALTLVHIRIHDTIEGMTPALAMLFGCMTFVFTGAERFSVDHYLKSIRE